MLDCRGGLCQPHLPQLASLPTSQATAAMPKFFLFLWVFVHSVPSARNTVPSLSSLPTSFPSFKKHCVFQTPLKACKILQDLVPSRPLWGCECLPSPALCASCPFPIPASGSSRVAMGKMLWRQNQNDFLMNEYGI